jgi:hypothetical protein
MEEFKEEYKDTGNIIKAADNLQVVHLRQEISWGRKRRGHEV